MFPLSHSALPCVTRYFWDTLRYPPLQSFAMQNQRGIYGNIRINKLSCDLPLFQCNVSEASNNGNRDFGISDTGWVPGQLQSDTTPIDNFRIGSPSQLKNSMLVRYNISKKYLGKLQSVNRETNTLYWT
jgi:hypothetical protein